MAAGRPGRISVTSGFLERQAGRGSLLDGRDARVKLVVAVGAIFAIASEPVGRLDPFPAYYALILGLAIVGRVGPREMAIRMAAATPFILAAASVPLLSRFLGESLDVGALAASAALRGYAAIALLVILTATTPADELIAAMRRLRAPRTLSAVVVLMYRYLFLLFEEWRRMGQARACRTAGRLNVPRVSFFSKQIALVFLRAWERADRVEAAMTVRGFTGELPVWDGSRIGTLDWMLLVLGLGAFWAVRSAAWALGA